MTVKILSNRRAVDALTMTRVGQLLGKLAYDIEAWAKIYAPVDTGFLEGSIQAAQESQLSWLVKAGASYAAYVELGTKNAGAQPYLVPAVQQVKQLAGKSLGTLAETEGPATP